MPGIVDWLNFPLEVVRNLLAQHGDDYRSQVITFFSQKLAEGSDALLLVPSLNDCELHDLKPDSLVRFRCMVQDMYGPELYLDTFDALDGGMLETRRRSGLYRDVVSADCRPSGDIDIGCEGDVVTKERYIYYCIPVPGENDWVKKAHRSKQDSAVPSTSAPKLRNKRPIEDNCPEEQQDALMDTSDSSETKKKRTMANGDHATSAVKTLDGNFPLPGEKGPACLVKIYENADTIKLNDVIEVVGVLSVDPALTVLAIEEAADELFAEEYKAHNPPASLVPRLHTVAFRKVSTLHPPGFLPVLDDSPAGRTVGIATTIREWRDDVVAVLERALCGDVLAAEYAMCGLLASVYARQDHLAVGKLCVNISNCLSDDDGTFVQSFYRLLQELRPVSFELALTVANANALTFVPKKDYNTNRLTSGLLQLASGTLLVVDETRLQPGQLDQNGVANVAALSALITWQKVAYDFSFHQQEFECDVSVLTLSQGKSILPSDCHVILRPAHGSDGVPVAANYEAVWTYLTPQLVDRLRSYLCTAPCAPYEVSEEVQKWLQDDFVSSRQEDVKSMSIEDFQLLLTLARLVSLSYGNVTLTKDVWSKVRAMEAERKLRLAEGQLRRAE